MDKGPVIEPLFFEERSMKEDIKAAPPYTNGMFIENGGQWDDSIMFAGLSASGPVRVMRDGFGFDIHDGRGQRTPLKYEFVDGSDIPPYGISPMPTRYNFYMGNDPSKWASGVRSFKEIMFDDVWKDIDLRLRITDEGPKYDLIVRPGAHLPDAGFRIAGIDELSIHGGELLLLKDSLVAGKDHGLLAYQGNVENIVEVNYRIISGTGFSFEVGDHEVDETLIIDPLVFCNYLGGSGWDEVTDSELDPDGGHYLTGFTYSSDFPVSSDAYDNTSNIGEDIFLSKVDRNGTSILYSTYIGGWLDERGSKMELDDHGFVYLTGFTRSSNFPTTPEAIDRTMNGSGQDAFLVKMDTDSGELLYSTFIGGMEAEEGRDIGLADNGDIIIAGYTGSDDFPVSGDAYHTGFAGIFDLFLCRISSNLTGLVFSTSFGGIRDDVANDLALLKNGDIVISGDTDSDDLYMAANAHDRTCSASGDCFIFVLDGNATEIKASTYFGGNELDLASGLDVDDHGNIYLGGTTLSDDLQTTKGSYQESHTDLSELFAAKFDGQLSNLVYCTYIGSQDMEEASDLVVDERGQAYMVGLSYASRFPTTWGAYQTEYAGETDCIFFILNAAGSDLLYSTYLGGEYDEGCFTLELIDGRTVLLVGYTTSGDFPTNPEGFGYVIKGGGDGFTCALDLSLPPGPPENLTVIPIPPDANLTWEPPIHDGGLPVDSYIIRRVKLGSSPRLKIIEVGAGTLRYHDEDLEIGFDYIYRISARNAAGASNFSGDVIFHNYLPPTTPRNLRIDYDPGIVNISWSEPEYNGSAPILHYVVEKRELNGDDIVVGIWNSTSTVFLDPNITKGKHYRYSVWAFNGYWLSNTPGVIDITPLTNPSPPYGLAAGYGNRYVNITWSEPHDDGGLPIIGYHIYRGLGPDNCTIISTIVGNGRYFNDTTVVNGIEYFYRVSASNGNGISNTSEVVSGKPIGPPNPPWKPELTIENTVVYLTWDPPTTDGGSPIIGYRIYRWLPGMKPEIFMQVSGDRRSFNDTSVLPNSEYYYFITAVSALGESDPSEIVIAAVMGHPTSPRSLQVIPGPGYATIEWLPPSDTGHTPLTGYYLYKRSGEEELGRIAELTADEEFYVDHDIELGILYGYRVTAVNGIGESRPSEEIEYYPVDVPSPPQNLIARSSENMVELTWSPPWEDGGAPISEYHIFRGTGPGDLTYYRSVDARSTSFQDRNVMIGTEYYYQVRAFNGIYNSYMSQIA
ncbi:MAG: fibronectin type III domain-containing protein, partial [Thermoplasmatota archaeon]